MFMGIFLVLIKPSPAGVQTGLITEEHIFIAWYFDYNWLCKLANVHSIKIDFALRQLISSSDKMHPDSWLFDELYFD